MDMVNVFMRKPRSAEEREQQKAKRIDRCEPGGHQSDHREYARVGGMVPGGPKDHVLAENTGEARNAGNRQHADEESAEGPGHQPAQSPHAPNILNPAHAMNDASGAQEEERFEECMGHQMKHTGG